MTVTQTVEFPWSGSAPTAKIRIFGSASDAITQTASSVVAGAGNTGIWNAVFTDVAAGDYWFLLYDAASSFLDAFQVRVTFATGTTQAKYNLPDPVTSVEPSRLQRYQNKHYSSIVSSGWTKALVTTTDGQADPFGGTWAVRLNNSDTTSATHRANPTNPAVTIGSVNQYVVAWIRGTANQFGIGFSTTNMINYNVQTRTVLYAVGASLVSDEVIGDWRKLTVLVPLTNNTGLMMYIDCPNSNGSLTFTPPNTTNYYDIVVQITDDPDLYLYAPTAGTAFVATTLPAAPESYVAIAADVASIVGMLPDTDYLAGSADDTGTAVLDSAGLDEIKGPGWDENTDTLEKIRDAITSIATTSVVIPSPISEVIGMPETLEIGDSYDDETPIKLYVRDDADDPVTSFSGHDLADLDFAPTFTIAPTPGSARGRVVGTVTYVPASGPDEGYLKVEIPSLQSRRAVEGESSVQCVLKWDGYEKTLLSTTVRWLPRV